jgi:hypothetical protein
MVRIGRWADAAGRMQVKVADYNNNKRSDHSPTNSDQFRLKQGRMDDSHMVHEPQAVSASKQGPVVSEPQAVSFAVSSACFIFSSARVVSCSHFALIHSEAANIDTEVIAERFKNEQIEIGPMASRVGRRADSTGCGLDEVVEILDDGTIDTRWFGRRAEAAGWAQDEVADYNNNNKRSDLTLQQVRIGRWAEMAERIRDVDEVVFDGSPVPQNQCPAATLAPAILLREFLTPASSAYFIHSSDRDTGRFKMVRIGRRTDTAACRRDEAEEVQETGRLPS